MFRGQSGIYKLRELIRILQSNGWEFATIDDYSSSTPSVFMGKAHKRSGNPFDSFHGKRDIELKHMIVDSFISKGIKKYLTHRHVKSIAPKSIQIILSNKEALPTEKKPATLQ